jgi:hypothetical protein
MDILREGDDVAGVVATRIWEQLWLGSLADVERLAEANPHEISTVITLSESSVLSKRRGMNYIHIPVQDAKPVSVGRFDGVIDAIAENIRWGTVLLHSGEGVGVALSFTAAWMAAVGYKNLDAALEEIKRLRQFTYPSDVLLKSIRRHLQ